MPPRHPNLLLRRTMDLHASTTTGDTKRWIRSVGLRVCTKTLRNPTGTGWKDCGKSMLYLYIVTLTSYKSFYSSATLF
ncbi:MAG: hypothetical protein Q9164_005704, partial [Protoblastenia rupestris]